MLAFIFPPLFVVCALAALAYLFFQKLPEVERRERDRSGGPPVPLLSLGDRLKRVLLGIVERLARSFKLLSLKIHNNLTTLATQASAARIRAAERIAERKKLRIAKKEEAISFRSRSFDTPDVRKSEEDRLHVASSSETFPETSADNANARVSPPLLPQNENEQSSRLRQWFGKNRDEKRSSLPTSTLSRDTSGRVSPSEDEVLPPLVSEPLQPTPEIRVEQEVRRRAADIGRKFGDAVRRLRPRNERALFPAHQAERVPPQKKDQLEDILVERISLNPRDIEAYERLGDYYLEQKNLVDAKECYRHVLKLSPAYRLVKIKIRRLERLLEKEQTP